MNIYRTQCGFSTVTLSMLLMFIMTMITLISAHTTITEQRISANESRAKMAFDTADGGIDQGLAYLIMNKGAVLVDNDHDGNLDSISNSQITNVHMANGSIVNVTYSNPINNNFNLLKITATATSDDGTATKTAQQLVAVAPFLVAKPTASLIAKGDVNLNGNASITNSVSNLNIWSGGTVTLGGSVQTSSNNGSSSSSGNGRDIRGNDNSLASITTDAFFNLFFGLSKTSAAKMADIKLTGASNYSNNLANTEGKFIWIDTQGGDATLNANTVVGTIEHPVILVVDGNLRVNAGCLINGLVYTTGEFTANGNADLHGSLIVESGISGSGTPNIQYDQTVLNNLQSAVGNYTRVAGGWHDF